jgi:hypothetical protein
MLSTNSGTHPDQKTKPPLHMQRWFFSFTTGGKSLFLYEWRKWKTGTKVLWLCFLNFLIIKDHELPGGE